MPGAAYTDIGQLARYRGNDAAQLPAVARQFESMFVDMMLKAAREATAVLAEGNPFESFETRLHSEMLDHQLALSMSEGGGIGLAEVLIQQLGGAPATRAPTDAATALPARQAATDLRATARRRQQANPGAPAAPTPPIMDVHARTEKQRAYSDPVDFVRRVLPAVRRATAGTPLSPLAVLAQAALETGWGKAVIGDGVGGSSHNLFGIKSTGRWHGPSAAVTTIEVRGGVARREQAEFKVYESLEQAAGDLVRLLQSATRYQGALQAEDAGAYADAIGNSGYATDPDYGRKLRNILNGSTLRDALQRVLREEANGRPAD